jgi:restriction system protein
LLAKLKTVDPIRFERIVLDLMEKMNYGVGSMTQTSHDGGIDGIINEDELGLEKIYLQAKRYSDNKVNEKEMQNFVGALGCSPVRKGVFITTSFFDERAKKKAENAQGKVLRLIDGEELTKLMIKHNVGVQIKTKIEIKKIDEDFFIDEE